MKKRKDELKRKAALCHATSLKVRGLMRTIWQIKERELLDEIEVLETVEKLNRG